MDKWDKRFMQMAFTIADWSSCFRAGRKIGCVIVKDKRIMTTGYNGAPSGIKTCRDKGVCLRDKLGISGLHPTKASKQLSAYGGEVFEPLGIEMVRNITSLSRDLMLRLKPLPDNRFTRQFRDADDANDASDDIVRQRILARLKGEKETKQASEEGQEEGWPNTTAPVAQTASAASSASDGYTGGENP